MRWHGAPPASRAFKTSASSARVKPVGPCATGSRLTSPRVHFQVGFLPELLDSDQHPSRHQILAFFCAAIGSLRPLAHDEGLDLFSGGTAAERFPQIRSVLSIKTQVPDPVCGQATTVAASAERCGVEAMMPKTVPSAKRNRSAGAELSSTTGAIRP
jgi:hypothetical protein